MKNKRIKEVYKLISLDIDNLKFSKNPRLLTPNGFLKKQANEYKMSLSGNVEGELTKEEITEIYEKVVEDKGMIIEYQIDNENDINSLLEEGNSNFKYNDVIIDIYGNYRTIQKLYIDKNKNILNIGLYNENLNNEYSIQNFEKFLKEGKQGKEMSIMLELFDLNDSYIVKNNLSEKVDIYLFGEKLDTDFYYDEPKFLGKNMVFFSKWNDERNIDQTFIIFRDGTTTGMLDGMLDMNFTLTGSITTYQDYNDYLYSLILNNPKIDNSGKYNEFILMYKNNEIYRSDKNFYITDELNIIFYYRDSEYRIKSEIHQYNKDTNNLNFVATLNYPIINSIDIKNKMYLSEIFQNELLEIGTDNRLELKSEYKVIRLIKETDYFVGIDRSGDKILLENKSYSNGTIYLESTKLKGYWIEREGDIITAYGEKWDIKGEIKL